MKLATVLLTLLLLVGCVRVVPKQHGWEPPRPHPTQEQIWALTDPTVKVEPERVKLQLSVFPIAPLTYNDIRITCIMPNIDGYYEFGVVDKFAYSGQINGQRTYYMNVGCEPLLAYCSYQEYVSPTGYQKPVRITMKIEPTGECR